MTRVQGQSCVYRCGCTLSSDSGFRCATANGNEAADIQTETDAYEAPRLAKFAAMGIDAESLTVDAMTVSAVSVGLKGGMVSVGVEPAPVEDAPIEWEPSPAACAVHGEPVVSSSTWDYEAEDAVVVEV